MDYSITKLSIKYNCITKIKLGSLVKQKKPFDGSDENEIRWKHSEYVIIDREKATLKTYREIGSHCSVTSTYRLNKDEICDFFDQYDGEKLFVETTGDSSQAEQDGSETRRYKITVEFENAPPRKISGIFDGNCLPDDYALFMDDLADFISDNGYCGDLFNKRIYKTRKEKRGEYIFCSVEFENPYKPYYYLTDDESLEIDDFVIVPVGKNNRETVAHIVDVEYFDKDEVPMPLDKVKRIIRRADEEKDNFSKEWFY